MAAADQLVHSPTFCDIIGIEFKPASYRAHLQSSLVSADDHLITPQAEFRLAKPLADVYLWSALSKRRYTRIIDSNEFVYHCEISDTAIKPYPTGFFARRLCT